MENKLLIEKEGLRLVRSGASYILEEQSSDALGQPCWKQLGSRLWLTSPDWTQIETKCLLLLLLDLLGEEV